MANPARILPIHGTRVPVVEDVIKRPRGYGEPSRIGRSLIFIGAAMAQPDIPRGWGWNPSVITLCIVILSIVASAAYFIGHLSAQVEQLRQQYVQTDLKAEDAKTKATYAARDVDNADGHTVGNTNSVKKEKK